MALKKDVLFVHKSELVICSVVFSQTEALRR